MDNAYKSVDFESHLGCVMSAKLFRITLSLALFYSCNTKEYEGATSSLKLDGVTYFSSDELGQPPGGLIDPNSLFEPLLRADGEILVGTLKTDAMVVTNVAQKDAYAIPAGSRVVIIAQNGEFVRVVTEKTDGSEQTVEGFLPLELIDLTKKVSGEGDATSQAENSKIDGNSDITEEMGSIDGSGKSISTDEEVEGQEEKIPLCTAARFVIVSKGISVGFNPRPMVCEDGKKGSSCPVPGEVMKRPERVDELAYFELEGTNVASWEITSLVNSHGRETKSKTEHTHGKEGKTKRIYLKEVLSANDFHFPFRKFTMKPFSEANVPGESCIIKMSQVSPVVFDLKDVGTFQGVEPGESDIKFDLNGDGVKQNTGWIKTAMAFLAMDRNGDGKINSGRELFGEHTNGKRFENGYLALSSLDSNDDGIIDSSDADFSKLVLWRDLNMNAVTDEGELTSLDAASITKVSLSYKKSSLSGVRFPGGNDVRYESRFFGPKECGVEGCKTYDVFFGTIDSIAAR